MLGLSYWLILSTGKIFASKLGTGEVGWLTDTPALQATCWIGSVASVFLAYLCPMNEMWWGCLAPALVFSAWPYAWESSKGRETLVLSVTFIRNLATATRTFSGWEMLMSCSCCEDTIAFDSGLGREGALLFWPRLPIFELWSPCWDVKGGGKDGIDDDSNITECSCSYWYLVEFIE